MTNAAIASLSPSPYKVLLELKETRTLHRI